MKSVERYACLTFHTERLHDDRVWQLVEDTVRFLNSKSIPATWFSIAPVHPVYISRQFSSDKWLQRLKELSSKNQLIEQHTHFYKETKGPYDLSWKNLEKRLLEDKNWLASHEFKIKGFVGGGWAINKDLLKLLTMHDYLYDCSVAGFKSNYSNVMTAPNPTKFTLQSKYLVEIPTFSRLPLKRALSVFVLNKKPFFRSNNLEFCIFYLHDYDLLQFQNRIALKAFLLLLSRKYKFVTTRQLMEYLNLNSLPIIDLGK